MPKNKTVYEDCDILVVGGGWQELEQLLKPDIGDEIKNNLCRKS